RDRALASRSCPPVLLTPLTQTPEVDLPYPICRYIVPAGEAFPSALVEPWTPGRRQIIKTEGPTEASAHNSQPRLAPGPPYVRSHGGESRPQPPEFAAGGAHPHRVAVRQRHLRHPRG